MIHEAAAVGFERGADDYVAARPGYPAGALDLLVAELGLGPGAVRELLAHHPATRGRERFPFPHATVVGWCRKA